jgi:hypothetical protein
MRVGEVARTEVLAPIDETVGDVQVFCAAVHRAGG